jgi:hypothetical protein
VPHAVCMQTVLAPERSDRRIHDRPKEKLLRRGAVTSGAVYTTFLTGVLIVLPVLANLTVLWFLSAVVMAAAVATYAAGIVLHRRSAVSPSLRTRHWLSAERV